MITKASACSLVLTVGASAQNLRRVNCDGDPAAHFTDLPAAVAAASPGDTIWAYRLVPGSCTATFTAPVITKPLRIFGFLAAPSGTGPTQVNLRGPLVILGLGAGQRVELSGFTVSGHSGSIIQDVGAVVAVDCIGEVLLENVAVVSLGGPNTFVHFERCANVVLRGCEMILGGSPINCIDSSVLMTTTLVYHTGPGLIPGFVYATTAEGLRLRNSTVTLTGSVVRGAHRFSSSPNWVWRPGAIVESGQLRVGPASYLEGGRDTSWPGTSAYPYQILNPTVGSVVQDSRGTIGYPPMPPVGATVDIPAVYHSWAVANEPFGVTVAGPSGGFALLALGDWQPNTPSALGPLAMDPTTAMPVGLVTLSTPGGYHTWTLNCPQQAPVAHAFALQALTIAPNGALGITAPSPLTVGWPHGVVP